MKNRITFVFLTILLFSSTTVKSQWSMVCGSGNGFVDNFEIYNNELYATGFFSNLCGIPCSYVAKWNGISWQPVGNGFQEAGHALKVINNVLYGVRYESQIDSNWLYKFNGSDFIKFGEGVYLTTAVIGFSQTASLYNVIEYNGSIIVCGEFDRAGSKRISGIMKWNGTTWDSLSAGLSGNIVNTAPVMYPHDMCIFGSDLIVSGNFLKAGGQIVNGVGRWDGTSWHPMGAGFNSTVYCVGVYNGELFAGGDFTMSGTTHLNRIAKWNGSEWIDPGFSLFYRNTNDYTFLHTFRVFNNKLFISGGFDRAKVGSDTMICSAVASWNGSTLDTLQGGIAGKEVEALALYNGDLIAGGGLFGSSYIGSYNKTVSISNASEPVVSFSIYPNPTLSKVNITSEKSIEEVRITNLLGQTVYHANPFEKKISVNILSSGIYFVSVRSGKIVTTKTLRLTH